MVILTANFRFTFLLLLAWQGCQAQPGNCAATNGEFLPLADGDGIRYPLVLGPVFWRTNGETIYPVVGSDGNTYLVYEALITNLSSSAVTLKSFEVVDPDNGNKPTGVNHVATYNGSDVTGKGRNLSIPPVIDGSNYSADLPAGQSRMVYFSVSYTDSKLVPRQVAHRVTATLTAANGSKSDLVIASRPQPVSCTPAMVLSPPLTGERWLNGNGCCNTIGPHREVMIVLNGDVKAPERFAIDWVQLDQNGRLYTGPVDQLTSYRYFGADVLAAASGTIVEIVRNLPNEVPGKNPDGVTAATAAGNHVIVDMGNQRYALYAHLQPNSIPWNVGDFVRTGDKLGALGNSGNTDAPHLHFHVSDRPSVLDGNGIPYVFDVHTLQSRTSLSVLYSSDVLNQGNALPLQPVTGGLRTRALPLAGDVSSFVRSTTAIAVPHNAVTNQHEFQLDGSSSTSLDGSPLAYSWSSLDGRAAVTHGNTATPTVQFASGPGQYNFELIVTDGRGRSSSDRIQVTYAGTR